MKLSRKIVTWFLSLNRNERLLVSTLGGLFGLYLLSLPFSATLDYLDEKRRLGIQRAQQQKDVSRLLAQYVRLDQRLKHIQETFAQSQMSFEQVFTELDNIVRTSVGGENYDLKKSRTAAAMGLEFEKQEFTLNIRTIPLDGLITLLWKVENGNSPLFLGKVDMSRLGDTSDYKATLEIFSIRKGQGGSGANPEA